MATAVASPQAQALDRRGVALLSIAHVVNDANQSALPAIIPWLIAHRGLSLTASATLVLAMNLSSSVVQPLFGHLSDRRSLAPAIAASVFLATLGTAIVGFAPSMPVMLLGALVSGVGVAGFHPEASRFANYFAGEQRATGMSWFTTGGYLGFAIGPILITPLLLAFGLHGTACLLLPGAAIALLLLRDLPRFEEARSRARRGQHRRAGSDDWRGFGIMAAVVALRSTLFFAAVTFMPVFAIAVTHVDKAIASVALASMLLAGAAGTLWGGRLADRMDRRRVVIVSLAGATAVGGAIVAMGMFAPSFALLVLLAAAWGLAMGLSAGVIVVMGQEYLPQRIGIAAGLTLGLSVTIGGLAAPLFGWIGDHRGLVAVFAAATLFALAALVVSPFMPRPPNVARA